jgi:HD-GYP domain-containing protein (c-di-GMP phosphodiesterase class II)
MSYNDVEANNLHYTKKLIRDLIPGDIVLHPIYRTDGLMLVNSNKELSSSLISMIRKHASGLKSVLVAPSKTALTNFIASKSSHTKEFMQEANRITTELNSDMLMHEIDRNSKADKQTEESDVYEHNFFSDLLTKYPLWVTLDSKLESEQLKIRARQAKQELLKSMSVNQTFKELFNRISEYDEVLQIHSINTMCISLMIGLTLELNQDELFDLTVAALFSNVGFIEIEKADFLNYLRSYEHINEQLKGHLEAFSEMTKDFPELRKKDIVFGILDHHEYYNGKGYPNGKKGEEISLFGRILFIAHNYDELVGGYNYQVGLHPLDALRIIYENSDNRYDQSILDIFMHRTTYFKLGETISLPNIQKGVIIGFDDFVKMPHLPIVKLESGHIINLANS